MGELQATVELSVEFQKFYNVDLFQRGYYQIRSHVKATPKIPVKVEVSLPRNQASDMAFPACIINGTAVTKTFQILYRNEEVRLDDVIHFKIHAIVEAGKLQETLEKLDIQLSLELWYTEHGNGLATAGILPSTPTSNNGGNIQTSNSQNSSAGGNGGSHLECVSCRVLNINLNPQKGIHYHLPILFDYFHLSAVSLTIHAALVSLHQPYINSPKLNGNGGTNGNGKTKRPTKNHKNPNQHQPPTQKPQLQSMDALFFGNSSNNKSKNGSSERLSNGRLIHKEVCGILLSSLESLQQAYIQFSDLLHSAPMMGLDRIKSKVKVTDCRKRLHQLSDSVKVKNSEEEFLEIAYSDISQLCGELIVLWNNFINVFIGQLEVSQHLARVHHHQRVKRFSEAFFLIDQPRKSALECVESIYGKYATLTENLRNSDYLISLPPLPVSCVELDGDASTMPVIYEDVYKDDESSNLESAKRRHSFSDVKPTEISSSNEDIITALESISMSKSIRGPRPTSVPFPKTFLSDDKVNSLENPLSSLSSGYGSTSDTSNFKLKGEEMAVLANHLEDEEPNILTNKTCLPNKIQGFSHLEWSASIPYNMAEEPDDVQGMKHSHSCHSMPSVQNKVEAKTNDQDDEETNLENENSVKSTNNSNYTSESLSSNSTSPPKNLDKHRKISKKPISPYIVSVDSHGDEYSPPPEENNSPSEHSTTNTEEEKEEDSVVLASTSSLSSNLTNDQEALSKKLELVKLQSRSTCFLERPRAKSEELMIVKQKFPHQMLDAQKNKRQRLSSDSYLQNTKNSDELTEKNQTKNRRNTTNSILTAPNLVQNMCGGSGPSKTITDSKPEVHHQLTGSTTKQTGSSPDTKVKILPPPPKAFRDNYHNTTNQEKTLTGKDLAFQNNTSSSTENIKIKNNSSQFHVKTKENYNSKNNITILNNFKEDLLNNMDPASSVPMRRKAKEIDLGILTDHSTSSLSRIDIKRHSKPQDFFLVDSTGDMLETKPILDPNNHFTKKNTTKTDEKPTTTSVSATVKNDKTHVIELSCDVYNNVLSSTESQTLARLNDLIGEDMVAFVKAKEEFKHKKTLPGILYSDVIRHSFSVPYFHYLEDNRLMWQRNGGQHQLHVVICVHGLDGNSADLRLIKTYLEIALPGHNLDFLMSENNQGETFSDFETMTDRLIDEILLHINNYSTPPTRISFVGHSLGTILIRSAISKPRLAHLVPYFHTFLSLSGPHLGTLYNNSGLVNMGMWFMQKLKKSGSLHQLALKDATDIRQTFMYQLSQRSNLHMFRHVLLAGSTQDRYVPWHSARIEMCKTAIKDHSVTGSAYKEMVNNIISPIVSRGAAHCTLARYDIHHALPSNTNSLIGRAAHIAVLDSELFIEKFLIISILKYFQ